jgi:hypothetical protein
MSGVVARDESAAARATLSFRSRQLVRAASNLLSPDFGELPVADSSAIRSSRVRQPSMRRHVSRHHEVLGFAFANRRSPIRARFVRRTFTLLNMAVRIGADGVAF